MMIENINPTTFNWDNLPEEKFDGETGYTLVKSQIVGSINIRQVAFSKNYLADHWCDKGHIVIVVSGELILVHKDNSELVVTKGSIYIVGDNCMEHKAKSKSGATVVIVD